MRKILLLTTLFLAPAAFSDTGVRGSISNLVDATKHLQTLEAAACAQGEKESCDLEKLDTATIAILEVERRHTRNGKIMDHLGDAEEAITEAHDVLTGDD